MNTPLKEIKRTDKRIWYYGKTGLTDKMLAGNRWAMFLSVVQLRFCGYGLMWVDPYAAEIFKFVAAHDNLEHGGISVILVNETVKKLLGGSTIVLGIPTNIEW